MQQNLSQFVNRKENIYFQLMLLASLPVWGLAVIFLLTLLKGGGFSGLFLVALYFFSFVVLIIFSQGIFIGEIKNHGVKVTEKQLPGVLRTATRLAEEMGLKKVPEIYVIQAGGLLNAFATKFFLGSTHFMVLYSDVLELAYDQGEGAIEFIIAHELAHMKRNHITKRYLVLPASSIPFLSMAYYRACEFTCDSFATALTGVDAAKQGLAVLGLGKKLHVSLDVDELIHSGRNHGGLWSFLAEKLSTHPPLFKRFLNVIYAES